jgi:hypothetical protein
VDSRFQRWSADPASQQRAHHQSSQSLSFGHRGYTCSGRQKGGEGLDSPAIKSTTKPRR